MALTACPGCGYSSKGGMTVGHFTIYKCKDCGHLFCHECPGSNGARKCPECGSSDKTTYEKIYIK